MVLGLCYALHHVYENFMLSTYSAPPFRGTAKSAALVCIGGMFGFVEYNTLFASQQQHFVGIDSKNHGIFASFQI